MTLGNHSRAPSMASRILTKLFSKPDLARALNEWPVARHSHGGSTTRMPPSHFFMRKRRSKYMPNVEEQKQLKKWGHL